MFYDGAAAAAAAGDVNQPVYWEIALRIVIAIRIIEALYRQEALCGFEACVARASSY